jgi:hypothetical protein
MMMRLDRGEALDRVLQRLELGLDRVLQRLVGALDQAAALELGLDQARALEMGLDQARALGLGMHQVLLLAVALGQGLLLLNLGQGRPSLPCRLLLSQEGRADATRNMNRVPFQPNIALPVLPRQRLARAC